ncbi:reverse transcriptase domain-containing protein, partial [Tanacetum coccineum]
FAHLSKQVLVEILKEKSIQEKEVAAVVEEEGPTWMTPIIEYLRDETLPNDRKEASKLCIKGRQYELLEGILYRRSFLKPWLRATICSRQVPGKVKFLIVAMDYFTKWIKAKAVAKISGSQVKKFVWDNIRFASVKHPQSNGLVERANRSLGEGIKAHRTMIKSSNNDTPFSLTYGMEAVIPAEIEMPTYRIAIVDVVHNDEELRLNLNLLEERHERMTICEAKAKSNMTKYYNAKGMNKTPLGLANPALSLYEKLSILIIGLPRKRVATPAVTDSASLLYVYLRRGKDLDLSNLGDASSSVCIAASASKMARP